MWIEIKKVAEYVEMAYGMQHIFKPYLMVNIKD